MTTERESVRDENDKPKVFSVRAIQPCGHDLRDAKNDGGPNAQNLWTCVKCGKRWLR